jgi:hypothetical protein
MAAYMKSDYFLAWLGWALAVCYRDDGESALRNAMALSTVTYPLDVARRRLQLRTMPGVQHAGNAGFVRTLATILREGVLRACQLSFDEAFTQLC